ncbi:MAG: amidohydrolase family protein [Armatimonadetes bacterium]|nr:amidohydrolase family protein [Armatimonadota bacterium]
MPDIRYFDARCYLGRSLWTAEGEPTTPPALLETMDHFGIHEALVIDSLCMANNPKAGNARILRQTESQPRLHPAWAYLVSQTRELPPPEEFVKQMRQCGVGAVYLFYGQYNLPLEDWAVGDLLAALEEARVPLFLCPNDVTDPGPADQTDWRGVVRICKQFPRLPVIVTEGRVYRSQRAMYAAMAACDNLILDLSMLWLHRAVEFTCREFGAHRLVWSSRLPERTPGAPLMQLNYSDISEDELALVAGGNMKRLLSWNPSIEFAEGVRFPEPIDSLHRAARERLSLSAEEFYDCHGHIGWGDPYHVMKETPEGLVAEMDKFGIRKALVFSMQIMADVGYGIEEVAEMTGRWPDRFIGLTLVNPRNGERQMMEDLERGARLGMRGVKLMLNSYGAYDVNGPLVDVCARWASQRKEFILSHFWGAPERLLQLCQENTGACFIVGHSYDYYGEMFRRVSNVFLCTCPFLTTGQTERLVQIYGADRILFGSDLMDLPIGWGIGQIAYARIPEADKRKILGGNLKTLLRRYSTGSR